MRWHTNIGDPNHPKIKEYPGQVKEYEKRLKKYQELGLVLGEPKETKWFTSKQLKASGMIGIYILSDDPNEHERIYQLTKDI